MKDIRIPGFIWVVLIAAGIVFCENYLANPLYGEIAIALLMGAAKALNLGTEHLEEALELLRGMQNATTAVGARGQAMPSVNVSELKPNKPLRWLFG